MPTHKMCRECSLWLPLEKFKKVTTKKNLSRNPDGHYWMCSDCYRRKVWVFTPENEPTNRKWRRRFKRARRIEMVEQVYGLSEQDYMKLINDQKNICAICGMKDEGKVLCVDHDHKTGKVRGLLYGNCNVGLGNFKDDPKILEAASSYLLKSRMAVAPEKDATRKGINQDLGIGITA